MKIAIIIFLCMLIIAAIAAIAAHIWRNIETEIQRREPDLLALKHTKFFKKSAKDERKGYTGRAMYIESGEAMLTPEQQEKIKNIII